MAFNLQYNDEGESMKGAVDNLVYGMKYAKSREKDNDKNKPKQKVDTSSKPSNVTEKKIQPTPPQASKSLAGKLIGIINKNGGSPAKSVTPQPTAPQTVSPQPVATQPSTPQSVNAAPTLKQVAPTNPLTSEDSLNINIGLVHDYQQGLSKQLLGRSMQESMADMDKEIVDKNYMSLDKKNAAAMELRNAMLEAKKNKSGMNNLKLSPASDALYKSFIQKAAEKSILDNNYQNYLKTGTGLFIK